jgi:hypothetical protein
MEVKHNGDFQIQRKYPNPFMYVFVVLLFIPVENWDEFEFGKGKIHLHPAYLTLNIFYLMCLPPTNLVIKVCVDIVPSSHQNSTTSLYHPDGQKIGTCVVGERKEFVD